MVKSHVWFSGLLSFLLIILVQGILCFLIENEFNILQRDSVRNQREHLILLLANNHIRLMPKPEPLIKVFSTFKVAPDLYSNYLRLLRYYSI